MSGIPPADAEDVAQEAALKLVREKPRSGAPAFPIRWFAAIKQARSEYYRKRSRAKEPPLEELDALDTHAEPARDDSAIRLMELHDVVRAVAGDDALDVARGRQIGMTAAELAREPGWTPQRVEAARRRLKRGTDAIIESLED